MYLWDPRRFLWADLRHHEFAKERERERAWEDNFF